MLCRGPLALGKGLETLGKGFAEGCPRQRPLGEFLDGEGVFARALYRALGKAFVEGQDGPRQRKEAVRRRRRWRFFAEGRPSAKKLFFFEFVCRGPTLGK